MSMITYKMCDCCKRKLIERKINKQSPDIIEDVYYQVSITPIKPSFKGPQCSGPELHFCNTCYEMIKDFVNNEGYFGNKYGGELNE